MPALAASRLVAAAAAAGGAVAAAAPCYGRLNGEPFEEVCYTLLHNGTGGLQLREYAPGVGAAATLVTHSGSSAITVYQEALEQTSFYVIDYYVGGNAANTSLLSSRTVPLALRPPSAANPGWLAFMALAPSLWPSGKAPPKPLYDTALEPLGGGGAGEPVLLAVQRISSDNGSPQPLPDEFDALCDELRNGVTTQLPGYKVDDASPFTPTHARYYGENFEGTFEFECWLGVTKA